MPYDILEPEPKGYEVLEPEAEPKIAKPVENAIPDWMKGGGTPRAATFGGMSAVPIPSLADTIKSKDFQEALNKSPIESLGLTPDKVIPGTVAPKPLWPVTVPIAAGAKTAVGLASAMTSPKGLLELGALFTPAAPAVAAKWIWDMVRGGYESGKGAVEKLKKLATDPKSFTAEDLQSLADDVFSFGAQAGGVKGLGGHQISKFRAWNARKLANLVDPDTGKKPFAELEQTEPETPEKQIVADAAQALPLAAAEAEKGVTTDAIKTRNVQEGFLGERTGDDAQRAPAETSIGGGVRPTTPVTPEEVPRTAGEQGRLLLKTEPPPAGPEAAPQQSAPTVAAPEGEPVAGVTAPAPPGMTKGDISQPKEQAAPVLTVDTPKRKVYEMRGSRNEVRARFDVTLDDNGVWRPTPNVGLEIFDPKLRGLGIGTKFVRDFAESVGPIGSTGTTVAEGTSADALKMWKRIGAPVEDLPKTGKDIGATRAFVLRKPQGETKTTPAPEPAQPAAAATTPTVGTPPLPPGPGAKTVGEPEYSAAQVLTDQLKATPPVGTKEALSLREKIADKWAQGRTLFERAFGTGRAISESLKETARGVRDVTDLDRRVGELDYLLQRSSGLSKNMKKAILRQQPNKATREAVALWIDAGGDVARLQDTLSKLPPKTAPSVRRALERAVNLSPESVQFAEGLKQFYGIRLNDAQQAGVFEKFLDDYYTHVWQKPSNMPEDLRAHYSTGRVSDYFQFARQRSIPTFLDGILQGMKPVLDPAEVLPGYNYALDRAIASRKFVKELSEINAPDGRPAVLPTGTAQRVEGDTGGMFINPKGKGELGKDYHVIDHPAMRKWKWMGTDENGNPVMYRSDLAANPGVHERLARMLDQRLATPSKWGKRLLRASTEVKGLKLGLLSAFHQVHVGSHANWHWTNPFKGGEIDWDAPDIRFAIEKGHLKLAGDAADIANFAEGLISPGLVHKIPIVGPWSKAYSEWVFTVLIPRLKLNTFKNAYPRNLRYYSKDIQAGRITEEQIAARVGDSVNNAYGELNHWFLGKYGRSPQFQRILRGIFLAPDFGEARLRFAVKALTRYGMEERLAFATMIGTMYLAARVGNWLSHGDPELDIKNAFRVKVGKEWVSMRSVAGDLLHAVTNFGQFMYVRLNPLYSRTISDVLFQRDVYGRKLSMGDILLKRPAEQLVPINLTGLTKEDQRLWESAVTSMGLQVQHDVPAMDIGKLKRQWLLKNTDPKLRAMGERSEQELFPPSDYSKLRRALLNNDTAKAKSEYEALKKDKGKKHTDIVNALSPTTGGKIVNGRYVDTKIKPIGGEIGYANEKKFMASLSPSERKLYLQALAERKLIFQRFQAMPK